MVAAPGEKHVLRAQIEVTWQSPATEGQEMNQQDSAAPLHRQGKEAEVKVSHGIRAALLSMVSLSLQHDPPPESQEWNSFHLNLDL